MSQHCELEVAFPARPESAPLFRRTLRRFLAGLRLDEALAADLVLASGEAAGNAIEHAYAGAHGTVVLRAYTTETSVVVEVSDAGRWRLGGDAERGRGLGIMKALVDHVSIESTRAGTCVRLELSTRATARGRPLQNIPQAQG
jgi:anti-sigma regulatory factor (Ser/Thr protein kinase)